MDATQHKKALLNRYRWIATALLFIMAMLFAATFKMGTATWVGYVRAFAEAAMVGALADWFAVTALFRHPLGLPIPHTNLIESGKENIGNNLGAFVLNNFLTSENIKPRITQLKVARATGEWLAQPKNSERVAKEITQTITDALDNMDDAKVTGMIQQEAQQMLQQISLPSVMGKMLHTVVHQNMHQPWITLLAKAMSTYMEANKQWLRDKVHKESSALIPGFVDNIVANKISKAVIKFFNDVAQQEDHSIRIKLNDELLKFADRIQDDEHWQIEIEAIKKSLFSDEQMQTYAHQLWLYVKEKIKAATSQNDGALYQYMVQRLQQMAGDLQTNETRQEEIDAFVQKQIFQLIMKHRQEAATFISQTVGSWKGRELSERLELEVGKDLQFIRINGTVVGGLVGLLIHAIVHWLG